MLSECMMNPKLYEPFFDCKYAIDACEMLVECGIVEILAPVLCARAPPEVVDLDRTWPSVKYHVLTIITYLAGISCLLALC
jgi:hypothetical protein